MNKNEQFIYYKDFIQHNINLSLDKKYQKYHYFTAQSIKSFWEVSCNNPIIRSHFYPEKFFNDFILWIDNQLKMAQYIVDIGCGTGTVLNILCKKYKNKNLFGVDLSKELMKKTNRRFKNYGINFKVGSIEALPFENSCLDVAICTEVLEHLDPDVFCKGIKEIRRILKPNGILLATLPINEQPVFVSCPECNTIFTPYQHMLFNFTKNFLQNFLKKNCFKIESFYYPVNRTSVSNPILNFLKQKIIISLFPIIAQKIFPLEGITGFVARKIG